MLNLSRCVHAIATCATALVLALPAHADIAASVNSQGLPIAFSSVDVSQGWRFTPAVPIQITALGLLDANNDGFSLDHPIGLWSSEGELLAGGVISAGTVHPLINRFRYVALEDQPTLIAGEQYTIGYFLQAFNTDDGFVVWNGVHTMHPAIQQIGTSFFSFSEELVMPTEPNALGSQCFGPNFQFIIVPAPGALMMIVIAGTIGPKRRRLSRSPLQGSFSSVIHSLDASVNQRTPQ